MDASELATEALDSSQSTLEEAALRYAGEVSRRNAEREASALRDLLVAAIQFAAVFQFVQWRSDDPQYGG